MATKTNQNLPDNLPPIYRTFDTAKEYSFIDNLLFYLYDFFDWWYIKMPIYLYRYSTRITTITEDQLSIGILINSFFTPWKRDRKAVGYFIGVTMRVLYLPIALSIYAITFLISFLLILFWIVLPLLSIIMLVLSPIF